MSSGQGLPETDRNSASATENAPTRWRGPYGNGIYPEVGLLKEWQVDGPGIIWKFDSLGQGFSSAVERSGYLYTTGMTDTSGYLFKFSTDGELIYKVPYGPEWTENYYGARGSPVIVGKKVYLESGRGKLVCLNSADGRIIWSKELWADFGGKYVRWGMNETPVIDGDVIYATPGGPVHNVIALNRHSGALIWSCPGKGEPAAYCTPLLFEHDGRKILTTHTASHLIGIDAQSGELLWSQHCPTEFSSDPNTPLYDDGGIYFLTGFDKGGGKLALDDDGIADSLVWRNEILRFSVGGAILIDGYIYESFEQNSRLTWRCVDWNTGEEKYVSRDLGPGNAIYADGMFYCYTIRGELALVKADSSGFEVVSKTKVNMGSAQHIAQLTISNGNLYLRHGSALIAYRVK